MDGCGELKWDCDAAVVFSNSNGEADMRFSLLNSRKSLAGGNKINNSTAIAPVAFQRHDVKSSGAYVRQDKTRQGRIERNRREEKRTE